MYKARLIRMFLIFLTTAFKFHFSERGVEKKKSKRDIGTSPRVVQLILSSSKDSYYVFYFFFDKSGNKTH
jgi:hypothetical protein